MSFCSNHSRCVEMMVSAARALCARRGVRFTPLREQVLKLVWTSHQHVKAYDILARLGELGMSEKPPTVYRTLDFLREQGLVHKLDSLNSYVGCSHPGVHKICSFLICTQCDRVAECCDGRIQRTLGDVADHARFQVNAMHVELTGVCEDCAA